VDPQFPRVYENYVEPFTGKPRNDREEEELFGPMKTARQRAIEAAAEELLGPASKARLAAAEPSRVKKAPAPAPVDRKKPAVTQGAAPAMSLPFPDTRESTAVNPSESAVNFALARGDLKDLRERLSKPTPETPEQQAYRKAQEEQYNRGIAAIDQQRQRFEAAARAGAEARKDQPMENLISRLARAGGAGSLFQGLSRAQLGMEPIIAAQRAAEQAANDKKIQYFDLLDQRKETVEGLKLAALKGDADRVAAETARLRAVDAEIAKLQIGLGEKQAGQQLTGEQAMARTQADIDARAREGEANRKNALQVEGIRSAARTAGAGERGALTPRDIARLRAQAEKDVDAQLGKDPRYVSMKVRDPVGAATYRTTTIDERLKRVLAEEGYGGAAPSPSPGKTYNFADIGGPK
jgi:hypothetical protein